jgi:glycosyltransferase involved in cell wall biosynthesis
MKIAFIHYHLKTGGVTTVIRQQTEALRENCQCLVLAGSLPDANFPVRTIEIPGLNYTQPDQKPFDPVDVAESMMEAIHATFDGECDVVHIHNPTLAKNIHFLQILAHLQRRDMKLFLQIHDFAEDGRPQAYFSQPYPSNCHYGVLNGRDYAILRRAGLKTEGLHIIPNMVSPVREIHPQTNIGGFVLYPIRAIRRKNIGEAILISLFLRRGQKLMITLPPNSPADMLSYSDWKSFVAEHDLAIEFEAGLSQEFRELVAAADFLITTSITEGFGFSFLEPWMCNKLLWGRRLDHISRDFGENGIRLDHLYRKLMVPVDWIGQARFYNRWTACVQRTADVFNLPIQEIAIKAAFEKMTAGGCVDFGLLDEGFQKQVIGRVLDDPSNGEALRQINLFLNHPAQVSQKNRLIGENKQAILKHYDAESYRKRLMEIYETVSHQPVHQQIDKPVLLDEFFDLEDLSLLKWCDYLE